VGHNRPKVVAGLNETEKLQTDTESKSVLENIGNYYFSKNYNAYFSGYNSKAFAERKLQRYVLTDSRRANGATALFYPGVCKRYRSY
jgi:hypothetical protein